MMTLNRERAWDRVQYTKEVFVVKSVVKTVIIMVIRTEQY